MMKHYILASALALGATGIATAAPFSYDYIEGGYGEIDDADALFVNGSMSLDKNLYALGGVHAIDAPGDVNGMYLSGGIGYHVPLSPQADLFGNAQLLYANMNHVGPNDDDLGAIARAGIRFTPVDKVELEGSLAFSSNDWLIDDGIGLSVAGRYHFDPRLSASLGYSSDTELDGFNVGVRYQLK